MGEDTWTRVNEQLPTMGEVYWTWWAGDGIIPTLMLCRSFKGHPQWYSPRGSSVLVADSRITHYMPYYTPAIPEESNENT